MMLRQLSVVVLATVMTTSAYAQGPSRPAAESAQLSRIEETIRGLTLEWGKVAVTRDTTVLKRLLAPDMVYVGSSGVTMSMEDMVASAAKSTDKITLSEATGLKIRVYGSSVAVVVGDFRERGSDKGGKAFDARSRFTNVWVLRNGAWQCVSGHSSDHLPGK